jgi:hypothetical protein
VRHSSLEGSPLDGRFDIFRGTPNATRGVRRPDRDVRRITSDVDADDAAAADGVSFVVDADADLDPTTPFTSAELAALTRTAAAAQTSYVANRLSIVVRLTMICTDATNECGSICDSELARITNEVFPGAEVAACKVGGSGASSSTRAGSVVVITAVSALVLCASFVLAGVLIASARSKRYILKLPPPPTLVTPVAVPANVTHVAGVGPVLHGDMVATHTTAPLGMVPMTPGGMIVRPEVDWGGATL